MIQAVLQEAARRPITDKPVKLLLEKLQDVAYNAKDVLDDFAFEILRKGQKKGKVRDCFSLHNPIAFHLSMGQKVKEINGSLDEIQRLATRCGLGLTAPHNENRAPEISLDREPESSLERSEVVVGRDGLGKTAIAKKICQLAREKKHFDVTLWQELENKTFLLVLDNEWDDLKDLLLKINKKNGYVVVVTTRSKQVASMMETSAGLKIRNIKCGAGSAIDGASHICHLNIISCRDVESIFGAIDATKLRTIFSMVDVFNRPRKFNSLRTLKLQSFGIIELPHSICKLRHLRYLDVSSTAIRALPKSITKLYHLETLRLKNCCECRQLSTVGCLPRLKILDIGGMGTVKCMYNEFYSSSGRARVLFPALKELTLSDMGGLEEWMVAGGEGDKLFPCLEKLSIEGCGKLKSIPIWGLSSLVEFGIKGCHELRYLSGEFHGFTSLQLLRIQYCANLESIPSVQHCTSLVELNI
ncbi:hypothetical protein SADUNF_Sadunf13G0107000 [Salix dunnii]|uniref:NB-ARC domain-containing protein n=1 Tax=Salix dunnii TaxID=1413687 RepID=A0A835MRJ8_9ROSI|nr:hypothetical protein SADUNF_Sadunf13G0107000 [Salix dunnii]